jgi:hypothetical protein
LSRNLHETVDQELLITEHKSKSQINSNGLLAGKGSIEEGGELYENSSDDCSNVVESFCQSPKAGKRASNADKSVNESEL